MKLTKAQMLQLPAGQLAALYVKLRDERNDFRAGEADRQSRMDWLSLIIMEKLRREQVDGFRATGTNVAVHIHNFESVTVADPKEFWDFVIENQAFDLVERRVAKEPAIEWSYANAAPDEAGNLVPQMPPGTRHLLIPKLGVRKV